MSEKKTISVMIPCYNEEQNARPIYEAVRDELIKSCPDYDYEILFIDNKSEDGTRAIIRQICAEDKHVKAIFNVKNFGQFNSPYYGMIHTTGDCTITMCADFQDPVERQEFSCPPLLRRVLSQVRPREPARSCTYRKG